MRKILYLFGPSASGKSTLVDELILQIEGLVVVDFDEIKRQIPNYDWSQNADQGREMTLEYLNSVMTTDSTILLLYPTPRNEEEYVRISRIASSNNYELVNIMLTAPQNVLVARYEERIKNIDPLKKHWKFKTVEEFRKKLRETSYIPRNCFQFNSSIESAAAIGGKIVDSLNS